MTMRWLQNVLVRLREWRESWRYLDETVTAHKRRAWAKFADEYPARVK
jgi:hypothetical protein